MEETAQQAQALGADTCVIPTDVSDKCQVQEMVEQTLRQFSTIDIPVNNAGIHGPIGPLQENDVSGWIQTIEVNLIGTYLCCRAVLPVMLRQGRGKIINLAGAGSGNALRHLSAYCSTKAAIVRLTEVLSLELADKNIQVNALSPGVIHTRMVEEERDAANEIGDSGMLEWAHRATSGGGGSVEQAAKLALFFASAASGILSGRMIRAQRDDFSSLLPKVPEIMASDSYTLRRVELD